MEVSPRILHIMYQKKNFHPFQTKQLIEISLNLFLAELSLVRYVQ